MSKPLRLVIFDVDGTPVDSQGDIVAAMTAAFAAVEEVVPRALAVLPRPLLCVERGKGRNHKPCAQHATVGLVGHLGL